MNKKFKAISLLLALILLFSSAGCSLFKSKKAKENDQQDKSAIEYKKACKLIEDYFAKAFSIPLKECNKYSVSGSIPTELKDLIAQSTIDLENGNPEIGLNYPRTMYLNNYMLGSYEIINDDSGKPLIETTLVGDKDGVKTYYVKVDLKVKAINFDNLLKIIAQKADKATMNKLITALADGNYASVSGTMENLIKQKTYELADKDADSSKDIDYIKVRFKYDVQIVTEDGKDKIAACRETYRVNNYLHRLSIFNNGPVERIPFLNVSNQKNSNKPVCQSEKDTYNSESGLITAYFNNICMNLNRDKMSLMNVAWNKNAKNFKDFVSTAFPPTDKNSKSLDEMMNITGEYRTKFDIQSFPLLTNMSKINGAMSNLSITQHPSYSEKIKKYIVSFQVPVIMMNGMVDGYSNNCTYDYTVTLNDTSEDVKISSMELNSFIYDN